MLRVALSPSSVDASDVVVLVHPSRLAMAITGDAFATVGAGTRCRSAALLLGYGVQVRSRSLPDTTRVSAIAGSTVRVIAPPDAVNGPTVPGVDGSARARPVAEQGSGSAR